MWLFEALRAIKGVVGCGNDERISNHDYRDFVRAGIAEPFRCGQEVSLFRGTLGIPRHSQLLK